MGEFAGKKILITGATGFLGGALARGFAKDGARVFGQGRNPALLEKLGRDGVTPAPGELNDEATVRKMVEGADYVVHCAALSSPWGTYADFHRANVTATETLADAALLARDGKPVERFVHISTPSIYSEKKHRRNIREDDPLPKKMISAYATTKWLADLALDRRIERGLFAIKLRPPSILGPGDTTVFPRLLRLADRKIIPVLPEGDAETDLTPIDNVINAVRAGLIAPGAVRGRAYNITNGDSLTIPEVLKIIHTARGEVGRPKKINPTLAFAAANLSAWVARTFRGGVEPAVTAQALCALIYSRSLNIEAARADLGFRPLGGTAAYLRSLVIFN